MALNWHNSVKNLQLSLFLINNPNHSMMLWKKGPKILSFCKMKTLNFIDLLEKNTTKRLFFFDDSSDEICKIKNLC